MSNRPKVYAIEGVIPVIHPSAYVHPTAVLIGDVIIGPGCYVGPNACLRGDFGRLVMEEGSNLQDTCVMHGFPGSDTVIEVDGHVGHGAVIHGARIARNALVGMNAVVMDGAVIGESSIVAAMAFVKTGMQVPPNYGPDYSKRFAAMYETLGKDKGVKLVPFLLKGLDDTERWFQPDRIHPNREAQPVMLRNVWPVLKPMLKADR